MTYFANAPFVDDDNSTTTALNDTQSFTGTWIAASRSAVSVTITTDQDTTYKIQFSPDASNVDSTLTYEFRVGDVEAPKTLEVRRQYYRVVVENNSGSNQTFLRVQTMQGNYAALRAPVNAIVERDADATVVRNIPADFEVALGKYQNITIVQKFGQNADIDTAGDEDVWAGGGFYTGFPTGSPEEFQILCAAGDVGGDITFRYTETSTSTEWKEATIELTGTTTNTGITGYRSTRAVFDDGSDFNVDDITCRHITTTDNVFWVLPAGKGQTRVACDHILTGHTALIKSKEVVVNKSNTATVTGSLWIREPGKSPRLVRPFSASNSDKAIDNIFAGLSVPGGSDVAIRIETCSANNTGVTANFDYLLIRD